MADENRADPIAGPLGNRVKLCATPNGKGSRKLGMPVEKRPNGLGEDANALILLRRLALPDSGDQKTLVGTVLQWAVNNRMGIGKSQRNLKPIVTRRNLFLDRWRTHGATARLDMSIEWRLVTGLGLQYGVLDTGIALHGTYGWPMIPASTIKGLARVGSTTGDETLVKRLLGKADDRSSADDKSSVGDVTFLDALPTTDLKIHSDVITPHQQPYYSDDTFKTAPGEHHNPVPLNFLSLSGKMRVDLLAEQDEDLDHVVDWLNTAGDTVGMGGRVTAGYGYFTVERTEDAPSPDKAG